MLVLLAALAIACSDPQEDASADAAAPSSPSSSPAASQETTDAASPGDSSSPDASHASHELEVEQAVGDGKKPEVKKAATRHPQERPLPAFDGTTLDGRRVSISSYIGKRLVLFIFNPEQPEAQFVADAVTQIAAQRAKNNFEIVGIAVGSSPSKVRSFAKSKQIEFDVLDDSNANIARKLGLRAPLAIYGVDSEGYLDFGLGYFSPEVEDPAGVVAGQLREKLRIAEPTGDEPGALDPRPDAPLFTAEAADGSKFVFADVLGEKPIVLIFFLHTCPHCHAALEFFKDQLALIPEESRPELVGISVQYRPSEVRSTLADMGLDYFPLLFDPKQEVIKEYGVFAGFPDVLLIDKDGKIVHRSTGWERDRNPAIARMLLAKIAGTKIPMLLNPKGYTGSDVCGICHDTEALTYDFTSHASAFDTLVTHNANRNDECVGCHVVGFDEPGGYTITDHPKHLENVGCESCHGRGGPHLSPDFVKQHDYAPVCVTCHNPKHSLGFEYGSFLPKISHKAIAALSDGQRAEMIANAGKVRDVLPKTAAYVGSNACQSCHEKEFEVWSQGPHGHAMDSLIAKQKTGDAKCLACHTTGMGRPGGFPDGANGQDAAHQDLASVGCESCHGPGGDHVGESAKRIGTIVSLGDKCDSCVILQICGSCHDDANDPGFEFEVEEKIERQRHGTIEAGTGKPLTAGASNLDRSLGEDLARAFEWVDERS